MRLSFGDLPDTGAQPVEAGWHVIHGPGSLLGYLLVGLVGLVIPCGLSAGLIAVSLLVARPESTEPSPDAATPWGAILLALLLFVPAHELLHAVCQPRWGLSDRTTLVLWPAKLRFGVYYDGCMSRTRWLAMRLAPFVALSLLPAGLLAALGHVPIGFAVETFLAVLMLANGIGAAGDVIAVLLVLFQIPSSATLCFHGGKAYWTPV